MDLLLTPYSVHHLTVSAVTRLTRLLSRVGAMKRELAKFPFNDTCDHVIVNQTAVALAGV